jgi:GNAT superfamily N-acetyltransferase
VKPEVQALVDVHVLDEFDSGADELDRWLAVSARQAQQRDTARVYVVAEQNGRVLAYSALVVATVERAVLASRARSGLPTQVPAVLLAKLAVDRTACSRGLGRSLLGHAAQQALEVRQRVAARLLVTEARDDDARAWYLARGMSALQDGRTCYARLADLTDGQT